MEPKESWHLSKTVNISHIITTTVLVIGMVTYISGIEREVALQNIRIEANSKQIEANYADNKAMFHRIDQKLDKLFDILYKPK